MANNRMYLMHVPSRKKFMLGKRMGSGYYVGTREDLKHDMNAFFDECEAWEFDNPDPARWMDNFVIEYELDIERTKHAATMGGTMANSPATGEWHE